MVSETNYWMGIPLRERKTLQSYVSYTYEKSNEYVYDRAAYALPYVPCPALSA